MTRTALLVELERAREELLARERDLETEREALRTERALRLAREEEVFEKAKEIARLLLENDLLRSKVDQLARKMFGKSSERIEPSQLLLAFEKAKAEEVEADRLETALGEETEETPPRPRRVRPSKKPAHRDLPVRVVVIEPDAAERVCAACGVEKERIGVESSEVVDYVPASFHVVRTERVKVACKECHEGVRVAPAPPAALEKCAAGPGLLAHVVTSKVADHLPLYRQEGILSRHGVEISRTTLRDWMAAVAVRLLPVAQAVAESVLEGRVVGTDDTPVTYLLPGRGTGSGYVWAYVGERSEVAYDFTEGRSRDGPEAFLLGFHGYVQADAFPGYDRMYERGDVVEVGCFAHARRYFVEAMESDRAEASAALALIQRLYAVEAVAKEGSEVERKMLREERSRPILSALKARIDAAEAKALPKGPLGKAISYAKKNWKALTRYTEEGFLEIDNNAAERALRPVALGRKNWLFAGSAEAGKWAAVLRTLVETCKLQGLDPFEYLKDVLERIATTPESKVKDLTPRRWKAERVRATPTA